MHSHDTVQDTGAMSLWSMNHDTVQDTGAVSSWSMNHDTAQAAGAVSSWSMNHDTVQDCRGSVLMVHESEISPLHVRNHPPHLS